MNNYIAYQASLAHIDDLHRQAAKHRLAQKQRARRRAAKRRRRLRGLSFNLRPSERVWLCSEDAAGSTISGSSRRSLTAERASSDESAPRVASYGHTQPATEIIAR